MAIDTQQKNTRSPLKDKPKRLPGQSLTEQRDKLLEDAVQMPIFLAVFMAVLAGLEWWRYYTNAKPNPVLYTLGALLCISFAAWRIRKITPKLRKLRLGLEGERAVGQYLEELREDGYSVFHDIVAPGFNIDHVIIGPAGVFAIETKTWNKPARGKPEITFDGDALRVNGATPERDPIVQAKAQAAWLKVQLKESTGRDVKVHPVLVFPGWFIVNQAGSFRDIWVLEPKALPKFLRNEPEVIATEDAKLLSYHLSRMNRG